MSSIFYIHYEFRNPAMWAVVFLSAAVFGIYLAVIILASVRLRQHQSIFLGLYISALSILLFHMSTLIYPLGQIEVISTSLGVASLYLIGPFSFHIHLKKVVEVRTNLFMIQLIPAMAAGFLINWITPISTWVYIVGLVHVGAYLILRGVLINRMKGLWNKQYTIILMAFYVLVVIANISFSKELSNYFTTICLTVLILAIWIRILRTSISQYIN